MVQNNKKIVKNIPIVKIFAHISKLKGKNDFLDENRGKYHGKESENG